MILAQAVKDMFSFMTKGRMTKVMSQGNCLYQIFVQAKKTTCCSGNSGDQLYMKDTMGYVVIINQGKNLGFVNIAGIRF